MASFPLDANMRSSYEEKKNELADKPFFLSCVPVRRRAQPEVQAVHHHDRLCVIDLVEAKDEAWNVSKREIRSSYSQTSHFFQSGATLWTTTSLARKATDRQRALSDDSLSYCRPQLFG